jgi:hypothetical protein
VGDEKLPRLERAFSEAVTDYTQALAKLGDPHKVEYAAGTRALVEAREAMSSARVALERYRASRRRRTPGNGAARDVPSFEERSPALR